MAGFLVSSNSMNQDGKFFSSDIIGFKGLQSFVVMNESLNMGFLLLTNKVCYCYCKYRACHCCKFKFN
jgi:hypothetical protein